MVLVQNTGDRAPLKFCHNAVLKCVIICFLPSNSNPTYTFTALSWHDNHNHHAYLSLR